jgi:hypothetical protein
MADDIDSVNDTISDIIPGGSIIAAMVIITDMRRVSASFEYEFANKLWKAYRTSEVFGEDIHRTSAMLQVNEQLFTAYLQSFNAYLQAKARADKWKQAESRVRIKYLIETMVVDFDRSYSIMKRYTEVGRLNLQHIRVGYCISNLTFRPFRLTFRDCPT